MIADEIRARADTVRKLGTYIGFFELLVFSHLRAVAVEVLFGSHVLSIRELFAPTLATSATGVFRVAAVRFDGRTNSPAVHEPAATTFSSASWLLPRR